MDKREKIGNVVLYSIIVACIIAIWVITTPLMTEKQCIKYIVEHKDDIVRSGDFNFENTGYRLQTPDLMYYKDITITQRGTSYHVIFWGDTDSWRWNAKMSKVFSTDVFYKQCQEENYKWDLELIDVLTFDVK